jgi:SpoVK/Ycf46/Vps4 family AAA+-type ATPase
MYTWEDLVLKKDQKEILMQACNHVKYKHIVYNEWKFNEKRAYGNGVCILFTGSPGTGKTMAAQVVANNLNINMYKVDLSAITSKYIGETEKNIKKLFYEAKKSNAVLFFDEADTIFGKRTEVKDSNDKYANMDAAYLLQKIEEYEGISILATNYIQNIDEAFIRRISFIVRFSMPEFNERKLIWEKSFPAAMPLERDLDFDFLANQFQLSGSNIKNIALHSAFLAAANKEGLSMKYVIEAIKTEYLKVNKILMKEDFGPYGDVL